MHFDFARIIKEGKNRNENLKVQKGKAHGVVW